MINILGLKDISYKEKKHLIVAACQMYKKLQAIHEFIKEKETSHTNLSDKIVDAGRENFKSISLFETLLNLMSVDYSMVIQKEFIEDTKDDKWYEQFWSKTTFYKVKKEAMDSFLFLFYV